MNGKLILRIRLLSFTFPKLLKNKSRHRVTNRKITVAADVNIAAVNHYFGSKENVILAKIRIFD
ncbi:TetR family transcriptional regulator [bacterium BFN5]|nr:TetR family transcriptional regulator [bacterium BFN5]